MASTQACRLAFSLSSRRFALSRGFQTSCRRRAATNFTMPALSPTMTEGSIVSWHKKEGEAFSAGEVLLEIETDKATMDVEAQDDGVLAKILMGDGSKGVQVGARIAVTAEEGDDLTSLEIPEDSAGKSSAKGSDTKVAEAKETPKKVEEPQKGVASKKPSEGGPLKLNFTPSPSVAHLLKEKGISSEDAKNIQTSGPKGRMLKGDVLAYLGQINKAHPQELSSSINKLAHLDLSNIKIKPRAKKDTAPPPPKPVKVVEEIKEVAIPLSFAVEGELLKKVVQEANKRVPVTVAPTSADLFNQLVGGPSKTSSKPNTFQVEVRPAKTIVKETNVYDVLTGKANPRAPPKKITVGSDLLTVRIGKGQTEKQGKQFLAEVNSLLQQELHL